MVWNVLSVTSLFNPLIGSEIIFCLPHHTYKCWKDERDLLTLETFYTKAFRNNIKNDFAQRTSFTFRIEFGRSIEQVDALDINPKSPQHEKLH